MVFLLIVVYFVSLGVCMGLQMGDVIGMGSSASLFPGNLTGDVRVWSGEGREARSDHGGTYDQRLPHSPLDGMVRCAP